MNLLEELMLLLVDPDSGKIPSLPAYSLEFAAGGAVLLELSLQDRIDCDLDELMVVDDSPTGDAVLDPVLERLAARSEPQGTDRWLWELKDLPEIRQRALEGLVQRGILRCEDRKRFWLFGSRRYPMVDRGAGSAVVGRIRDIVEGDRIPEPRDAVLLSLVKACSLLPSVLGVQEVQAAWDRISRVATLDLMAVQILDSLSSLHARVHRGA